VESPEGRAAELARHGPLRAARRAEAVWMFWFRQEDAAGTFDFVRRNARLHPPALRTYNPRAAPVEDDS
jgi:hypothetical protein